MPSDRQIRLALWLALIATANANRKHFGLRTTWLPHSVGNTVALSLPELTAALRGISEGKLTVYRAPDQTRFAFQHRRLTLKGAPFLRAPPAGALVGAIEARARCVGVEA